MLSKSTTGRGLPFTYINFFAKKCFYAISSIAIEVLKLSIILNVIDSRMRATLYIQLSLIKCDNQLLI